MLCRFRRAAIVVSLVFSTIPLAAQQAPKRPATKAGQKPPVKKPQTAPAPAPEPPKPDLSIATKYTSGDKTTTSTVILHEARQRISYESELAAIQQCDAGRGIQLNTKTRTYLVMPFESAPAAPASRKKGGKITYTTAVIDTKETKEMFGFTAHHVKTVIAKEASADACDKKPEHVEIDGWYVDLPGGVTCAGAPAPTSEFRVDPKDSSCVDEVTFVRPPSAATYPVSYTMATSSGSEAPVTTTMEATEVTRIAADPQMFDVPADYVAVKSVAQLTADHRPDEDGPKKPGVPRIGVAPLSNNSGQQVATSDLVQALADSLGASEFDVILLKGNTPEARQEEARTRSCDYILENTVAEIKKPGKGVMSKLSGSSSDSLSAKVDFALSVPGQPKPTYAASERSGGSMIQSAIGAAKRISHIVLPFMLGPYGYMNAFAAMSGAASPLAMQQAQDPVLSTVFALVDRATANHQQETFTTEESAVASALNKEAESIAGQLKKKSKS